MIQLRKNFSLSDFISVIKINSRVNFIKFNYENLVFFTRSSDKYIGRGTTERFQVESILNLNINFQLKGSLHTGNSIISCSVAFVCCNSNLASL